MRMGGHNSLINAVCVCVEHDHADRLSSDCWDWFCGHLLRRLCDHLRNGTTGKTWELSGVSDSPLDSNESFS